MDMIKSAKTSKSYDVFISNADEDRAWVEDELLPRLNRSAIIPCVSFLDFELGALINDEVEKAVGKCAKTILILTPSYLEYEWGILESMKVMDRKAHLRKFIPLILKHCEPPLHVKSMIYLDFTTPDAAKLEKQWDRLIRALKQAQRSSRGEDRLELDRPSTRKTKFFKDILLQAIEEKLRMNTEAHWIQTGFEIPEDQFSFTVVFFESQLEILGRLESELSSVCERLDHNQIHLGSNVVQKEIKTLLELIKIRAEQLADVLDNDLQHELGITIDMALRSLMNNLEAVRSRSIKLQIGSLLQPTNRQEQSSEFRAELYAVLLSLGEVLKFSRQLHTRAEKEWSSVVRDE